MQLPSWPLSISAAPETFLLTQTSYSHSTSTSLFFMSSFSFLFVSARGFLQSIVQPHQSTEMTLERTSSHIKVTCPPCLFRLPPWENENRSIILCDIIH